jgi:hypothetical protein
VFALLRTPVATEPKRSHECERGTQECVRHGRLHHLWWATRPMGTPSRSRLGNTLLVDVEQIDSRVVHTFFSAHVNAHRRTYQMGRVHRRCRFYE